MRFQSLVIIGFLFFSISNKAQDHKLGKVTIVELEEKVHPKDSSAAAAVLYRKGEARIEYDTQDGFVSLTEVEVKIKIYKKEGYDFANQKVWYYDMPSLDEKVSFTDAYTYNLVNGKIEKTKLKSEGIFDVAIDKNRRQKKITMPNVKEGSVIEYRYTIKSPRASMIREWYFQSSIPVNYTEFTTYIPEYFVFNSRQKGYVFPKITSKTRPRSVTITFSDKDEPFSGGFGGGSKATSYSTEKFDYTENQTTYIAENFPAIKNEDFVNNIDNYVSSIQHELSMTKLPNKPLKPYSTDWDAVAKTIYDYDSFGLELNKTGYYEDDIKVLLAGKNTPEEKIWAIFNHVKSTVKWDGTDGYDCDKGVKKAYKEKSGNIGDINLMLTSMLRYAGLTANPVLVSTRSNGIALFPNTTAYDYVIAAVETPNGNILLDASDKFSSPNILPFRDLNWSGRLIRNDGSSQEIDLMPKKISNDFVSMSYSIDADGKITGKTRRQCTDYRALLFRDDTYGIKEEEYLGKLENESNNIEITDHARANEKDILLPTIESYSFTGNNLCDLIAGKIYVSPMLFFHDGKNPFNQEIREYPVDFGYPFLEKYNITIQIPEGFTVESLPVSKTINMQDNVGSFKFSIVANGNSLQLNIMHQINEAIVTTEQYDMLKEYYKTMMAKESEKIVLKRI